MKRTRVAILQHSSILSQSEVRACVAALQRQVDEHFAPAWGIEAQLVLVPKGKAVAADLPWLALLDNPDQAGALGYHDFTPQGQPLGKVFAEFDRKIGNLWTVTASHELLELLADPDANLGALIQDRKGSRLYAREVCDPTAHDPDGYEIDGVRVSNFVHPAWFHTQRRDGPFDQRGLIKKPLELRPGGYIGVMQLSDVRGEPKWETQAGPRPKLGHSRADHPGGARRRLRERPQQERKRSRARAGKVRGRG